MNLKSLTQSLSNKSTNSRLALIQAITRSLLALLIIAGSFYLLLSGIEIPQEMWYVILIAAGATFGVDGILAFLRARNGAASLKKEEE